MAKTTYIGESHGQTVTRKTDRVYTHAIISISPAGTIKANAFCGTPELAIKAFSTYPADNGNGYHYEMIEVKAI
jgi:hypothetical protein